MYQAKKVSGPV